MKKLFFLLFFILINYLIYNFYVSDNPIRVVKTYYKGISSKDYQKASSCLDKDYAIYLSSLPDSDFNNIDSLSNLSIDKPSYVKSSHYDHSFKEAQIVVTYYATYKNHITSDNGNQIKFIYVVKDKNNSPWRIVLISSGP